MTKTTYAIIFFLLNPRINLYIHYNTCLYLNMNPLKPEKGERYVGSETKTIYEWDGEKWVDTGVKEAENEAR